MTTESAPRPGVTWETELRRYETVAPDDHGESPYGWASPDRPNRATRRALARATRRSNR